jgi:hypothetical protein
MIQGEGSRKQKAGSRESSLLTTHFSSPSVPRSLLIASLLHFSPTQQLFHRYFVQWGGKIVSLAEATLQFL